MSVFHSLKGTVMTIAEHIDFTIVHAEVKYWNYSMHDPEQREELLLYFRSQFEKLAEIMHACGAECD
jgi:hypothetical protein